MHPPANGPHIPGLLEMVHSGCPSPGVVGVFPTVTYPTHTSMMTGDYPAVHGIVNNTPLDPFNRENGGWYYYAEQIRVPTLWQTAKAAGLKTGSVWWPVTVGANIDWSIPEYRSIRTDDDVALSRALSTSGLFAAVEEAAGRVTAATYDDAFRARAASYILTKHRPNLMLLHLIDLDHAQHLFGIQSAEATHAIEEIDGLVQSLIRDVKNAGFGDDTAWLIVSDHGFQDVQHAFQPRVMLRNLGDLKYDENGKLADWTVYPHGAGGSVFFVAKDPANKTAQERVIRYIDFLMHDPAFGIEAVFDRAKLNKFRADPSAFYAAVAAPGYLFGSATTGPLVTSSGATKATHGYDPSNPRLFASLILYGAGMQCGTVEGAHVVDIGPTAAELLGVNLPARAGRALVSAK